MIKKITITVLAASLCMLSVRCIKSDGELGDSTVVINLGLDQAFNAPKTRFDRFMNFIMPKAYAAPSNIASVSIVVSAEDIKTFENSYSPPPTYITVTVPAGKSRFIQVIGYVKDGDPSAVLSYRGTLTADLEPGETKEVAMQMVTYETKLVIPDFRNYRIVQIENMAGKNWIDRNGSQIGYGGAMQPYDIDFDAQGRIYIISNSTTPLMVRIDNIYSTTCDTIVTAGLTNPSIAIDRKSNLVYYTQNANDPSTVYRRDTAGGNLQSFTLNGVEFIRGLAVDTDGILYIATTQKIHKFNPSGSGTLIGSYTFQINGARDICVKDDKVFVSNNAGANGYRFIELDKNLRFVRGYGSVLPGGSPSGPGKFYGPERIVAKTNRKIFVIDESDPGYDQLLAFDDIDGENWQSYGSKGVGVGYFKFYEC
ncbi:MAG TPA: hypothetical protein PKJ16_16965 [Spirochaetota bacterium]|nr:hypothetical protein [Spirochaetota bacterium]HPU88714.1 hypothetical protein [Spirochaetota bacterium]